jgi:hypothetical protein
MLIDSESFVKDEINVTAFAFRCKKYFDLYINIGKLKNIYFPHTSKPKTNCILMQAPVGVEPVTS